MRLHVAVLDGTDLPGRDDGRTPRVRLSPLSTRIGGHLMTANPAVTAQIAAIQELIGRVTPTVEFDDRAEDIAYARRGGWDSEQDIDAHSRHACDRDERGAA